MRSLRGVVALGAGLCAAVSFAEVARAEEAARIETSILYVEGGDKRQQSLDVYAPKSGSELPVMVWIHGGGWQIGDKWRVEEKPATFNARGFVFVSINYRLHPTTDYRGQGEDVAKAIDWVREHIKAYGGSPEKIFLMGHSAGAHLAALVATDPRYLTAEGMKLSDLRGVVLLDGACYDIPRQRELAVLPRMRELYRTVFTDDVEKQKDASPIEHVERERGIPPFLILHVATRRDGRIQSEALGKKLSDAGVSAKVIAAENKTHATINREIGKPDDVPTRQIFEFLQQQLKESTE